MDIMLTVHPWKDAHKALEIIKEFPKLKIQKIRVNLKTLYRPEHLDELFSFVNMAPTFHNIEWCFDIGLPGDSLRLVIPKSPYNIPVSIGTVRRIYFDSENFDEKNDTIYIRKATNGLSIKKLFSLGDRFLYGDGEIEFEVVRKKDCYIEVMAMNKGTIWDGKAIYTKETVKARYDSLSYLLYYINNMPLDAHKSLICSMAESSNEIELIKKISSMKVISKVETLWGIKNIEDISKVSDGIMLGRGDLLLGVRDYKQYYLLQEEYLKFIQKYKTQYSIIATDIFDSMCQNNMPARSEITDAFYLMKFQPKALCLSSKMFYSNNLCSCISLIREISS